MICKLCGNQCERRSSTQKYCGFKDDINTCAGKVHYLEVKLVAIKRRCYDPRRLDYKRYGKFEVYKGWLDNGYSFVLWALKNGWRKGLTIDRIKNVLGYFPENCRFVTIKENVRNRTNSVTNWQEETRRCCSCHQVKKFTEFYRSKMDSGGRKYICGSCCIIKNKNKKVLAILVILLLMLNISFCYAQEVDTTRAILHHTATKDVSITAIIRYHVKVKGWDDIGYHFVIRENGNIEKGRSLDTIGAHAKGRNHWVGIALTGNDYFTIYQLTSLYDLLKELGVTYIEPHYEDYACPGESLRDFIETYNQRK